MGQFRAPNVLVGISLGSVLLAAITAFFTKSRPDKLRDAVVKAALKEPAKTPRVSVYVQDALGGNSSVKPPKDWSSALVIWALHQASLAKELLLKTGKSPTSDLTQTDAPAVGDIAFFSLGNRMALIRKVNPDGTLDLINGNFSNGQIVQNTIDKSAVSTFYSIQPYIDEALS
jgi:hypothetical protein